jgi:hypothetical protein
VSILRAVAVLAACFGWLGCGSVDDKGGGGDDAAPTIDAASMIDAGVDTPDADTTVDASPPLQSGPPNTELVPAGGKMSGSVYTLDVQLGHAIGQGKTSGSTNSTEGAAAIKP